MRCLPFTFLNHSSASTGDTVGVIAASALNEVKSAGNANVVPAPAASLPRKSLLGFFCSVFIVIKGWFENIENTIEFQATSPHLNHTNCRLFECTYFSVILVNFGSQLNDKSINIFSLSDRQLSLWKTKSVPAVAWQF